MQVGSLVKLVKHEEFFGIVIQTLHVKKPHPMVEVEWCKDMGNGLYFMDELETVCK